MFTPGEREALRAELIEAGRADSRISGGALTGSASVGNEDRWSDIDLAFGVCENLQEVLGDFTDLMLRRHGALHHLDVQSGAWIYRVFLLPSTLQVDLAFAPAADFGARGPTFKLLFGSESTLGTPESVGADGLVGWAWLYALHARSSIARGRPCQAEYMISGMRDQVVGLACLRHDLPTKEARGADRLPPKVTQPLEEGLVRSLDLDELRRAFRVVTDCLIREVRTVDEDVANRLAPTLRELASSTTN